MNVAPDPQHVRLGMKVRLTTYPLGADSEGTVAVGFGFEPIGAVGGHPKYPFQPFYGGFSPRVSVAWNPRFQSGVLGRVFGQGKTVFRAGYSRIFDRNNGVDLVLVPLLGYGFGQTIRCNGAGIKPDPRTGLPVTNCYGGSGTDPTNGFRVGVDGNTGPFPTVQQTLPIPAEPGINSPAGSNISITIGVPERTIRSPLVSNASCRTTSSWKRPGWASGPSTFTKAST